MAMCSRQTEAGIQPPQLRSASTEMLCAIRGCGGVECAQLLARNPAEDPKTQEKRIIMAHPALMTQCIKASHLFSTCWTARGRDLRGPNGRPIIGRSVRWAKALRRRFLWQKPTAGGWQA